MFNLKSTLCAALALTFAAGTAVPAAAAPFFVPPGPSQVIDSNIVDVQLRRNERQRVDSRDNRREGRFERRGDRAFYNGQRGYRDRRPGYRQHNGFWFPAGAFIAGAILGGASNSNTQSDRVGSQHVNWCQNRWRSYRISDNSYQPNNGPRQRCVSPYS